VSSPQQSNPGKNIGQGMLIVSFALALIGLTYLFDNLLARQNNPNQQPAATETADGVREVVLLQNRQGHYVANGFINDVPVFFLLDTGATDVAIPANIAAQANLSAGFESRATTANGAVAVYATNIETLEIGNIILRDINASITPSMGGDTILLSRSALRQIEFTQTDNRLTLRQTREH